MWPPAGRIALGKKAGRSAVEAKSGKRTELECPSVHRSLQLFLVCVRGRRKNDGEERKLGYDVGNMKKRDRCGGSKLFGCTHREAECVSELVESRKDLFRRVTATEVTNERETPTSKSFSMRLQHGVTTWTKMPKVCVERSAKCLATMCQRQS